MTTPYLLARKRLCGIARGDRSVAHAPILSALLLVALLPATHAAAQQAVTAADYARAESRMVIHTTPLVDHAVNAATWLKSSDGSDRFWYRDVTGGVSTFMVTDAATGTSAPAFDHARLSAALSAAAGYRTSAADLPISALQMPAANTALLTTIYGDRYRCTLAAEYTCTRQLTMPAQQQAATPTAAVTQPAGNPKPVEGKPATVKEAREKAVISPDGKRAVFIRDWNLWLIDLATGNERALTTDGITDFGYATDNAGWTHSEKPIVVWSPDSRLIATFQQDQRKTGMMYLVGTNLGHPTLDAWHYPLPGDKDITMIERVIIDADAAKTTRLKMPPDQHRSSLCDDISCGGSWEDVQWSTDAKTLAFVSTSRDHKREDVRIADVATGEVRDVFHEEAATYFESGSDSVNWRYLSARNEILWFSERSNWGHLYLYDATTGKQKRQVTSGDWNVSRVLRVDAATGDLLVEGVGREKGWDPYYSAVYRTSLDSNKLRLLTPEQSNHHAAISPDGKYFVDVYSTPQTPPVTVLRDAEGKRLTEIAKTDITRLLATGWQAPENFTVKARDGKTELYGLIFKPSHFDPSKKYPIIDYIYPGPQVGSIGPRIFPLMAGDTHAQGVARSMGGHIALADLGFIVIEIDGMGTPLRSKRFHDSYYRDMGDATIPDQVTGIQQLAAKYSWIDLSRVGVWGHSGGGYATAEAMFRYPDFFKVGWSESGNHENRNYEDDWAEKVIGLDNAANKAAYQDQSTPAIANRLKGKLMLTHGMADDNVPPSNTILVVDALMRAGKDFDLLMIPNAHHGYGDANSYVTRRRWDYFVTNLMGATPPREYPLGPLN
ncbi:dipeptidyl aminopeptidase/acylaminoacyl peptidase [Terriglobus roseus DSM 18391]|uniref:Dipeptidyl aminopeptidase/acylaminoacyl peptidase n=1 Tax=Terriglobus roseus (strain DSM 18391 / NRRL B-41598 / KBS 63) TaxID=926566 RepID=I3ZBE7_TERRK|nr:DPP IV N-terminal domain-containing protein [Terriglobus roseus]AFL86565.1 dipeptidyl aminopeptidase/acylaminoacyl peptidase [Terriglobus roseus DSM 18391]